MAPNAEIQDIITMTSSHSKVHSLKAAIFHTMAYKLSLEINNNKITPKSLIVFLKVLYNVTQIRKKHITFEQDSRLHVAGPKIANCETASIVVFVLNSAFTSKDQYFQAALHEATTAFNEIVLDIPKNSNTMILTNIGTPTSTTSSIQLNQYSTYFITLQLHLFLNPSFFLNDV